MSFPVEFPAPITIPAKQYLIIFHNIYSDFTELSSIHKVLDFWSWYFQTKRILRTENESSVAI